MPPRRACVRARHGVLDEALRDLLHSWGGDREGEESGRSLATRSRIVGLIARQHDQASGALRGHSALIVACARQSESSPAYARLASATIHDPLQSTTADRAGTERGRYHARIMGCYLAAHCAQGRSPKMWSQNSQGTVLSGTLQSQWALPHAWRTINRAENRERQAGHLTGPNHSMGISPARRERCAQSIRAMRYKCAIIPLEP
jgi:hypothetical protein